MHEPQRHEFGEYTGLLLDLSQQGNVDGLVPGVDVTRHDPASDSTADVAPLPEAQAAGCSRADLQVFGLGPGMHLRSRPAILTCLSEYRQERFRFHKPEVRLLERGVCGQALHERKTPLPCAPLNEVNRWPGELRIDVVGRDRRNASPVVDAGTQVAAEFLAQVWWRLKGDISRQ